MTIGDIGGDASVMELAEGPDAGRARETAVEIMAAILAKLQAAVFFV